MNTIPKYPLDTAAKLALIRAGGWYYNSRLCNLRNADGIVVAFLMASPRPLNAAFHYFIQNSGKAPIEKEYTLKYKARNRYQFGIGDIRAAYGTN
jgi:hypothetical protein